MSLDRAAAVALLALSDRLVAEGEARVTNQQTRMRQLGLDGQDTFQAEKLLAVLSETLEEWCGDRADVIELISQLEAGLP